MNQRRTYPARLPRKVVDHAWKLWRDNAGMSVEKVAQHLQIDAKRLEHALGYRRRREKPALKKSGAKPIAQPGKGE